MFIKIDVKNERMFIRNFFKYYNSYDWSIPINIKNLPVKIETKSDKLVYICNIIDNEKLVRTLSPTTWNIILDEFKKLEQNNVKFYYINKYDSLYKDKFEKYKNLFYINDNHWNKRGNMLVSDEILEKIDFN